MTRFYEPSAKQVKCWEQWVIKRPAPVRDVARRFDPWSLYRMKSTGKKVTIVSFDEHEDGQVTLTVNVSGDFNTVVFERAVFGINPDDLAPCDPPSPGDLVGVVSEGRIGGYQSGSK